MEARIGGKVIDAPAINVVAEAMPTCSFAEPASDAAALKPGRARP